MTQAVLGRKLLHGPEDRLGVGYIRVSKVGARGDDLISPELQQHSIQTFADREGIRIVEWIRDIDKSGRAFTKRQVGYLVNGIKEGRWRYVILWKWSRWGRNMRESQVYLAHTENEGGIVRSSTEDFDPNTSIGRFSRDQMLLIAQLQSDMISDGWKEVQDKRRREGLTHNNGPRWGYVKNGKAAPVPDPELAPILRSAYERYVGGESHRSIALDWNAQGLTTVRGKRWTPKAVGDMLDTGFAAGMIREAQEKAPDGKWKGRSLKSFGVWREGVHKAVISKSLWEAYVARRLDVMNMPPRQRNAAQALSGAMVCGWPGCGATMVAVYPGRSRALGWACHKARDTKAHPANTVSDLKAQKAILDWIDREVEGGDDVVERARRAEAGRQAVVDVESFDAELRRLRKRRLRLAELYEDEEIDRDDYRARKAELDAAIGATEEAKAGALARRDAAGGDSVRWLGVLRAHWDSFPAGRKREALLAVTAKIRVMPKDASERVVVVPKWAVPGA